MYLCINVFCLHIFMCAVCAISQTRAEDGVESLGTRVRQFWAAMYVLGTKPWSSARTSSALNLKPAPHLLVFLETKPRLLTKHSTTQELHHQCRVPASPLCWLVYLDRFWCSPGWNLHSQKWPWTCDSCLHPSKCWDFRDVLPRLI